MLCHVKHVNLPNVIMHVKHVNLPNVIMFKHT